MNKVMLTLTQLDENQLQQEAVQDMAELLLLKCVYEMIHVRQDKSEKCENSYEND